MAADHTPQTDAAWVDPSCGCERSPDVSRDTPCPTHAAACVHYHTPHPESYLAHAAWAERMLKTHRQARCAWCGLWAVWIPKGRKITNKDYQLEMEAKAA